MRVDSRLWRPLAAPVLLAILAASAPPQPPILISAERSTAINVKNNNGQVTYVGDVVITRGAATIHGTRAIIYLKNEHLDHAVVTGTPATFTWQPKQGGPVHGHAATITYFAAADTVVFTGKVEVHRNSETFSSAVARYALKTGTLTAHGGSGTTPGRVHVVVPPSPPATGKPS